MTAPPGHDQPVGQPVPGWTAREPLSAAPMIGRFCRLERLDAACHADALHRAFAEAPDRRDWTYLPDEPPGDPRDDRERAAYREQAAGRAASPDPLHFAVLVGDEPLGTAALMRFDAGNGVVEIGHVNFAPRLQRTCPATEAIFLLMCRAFAETGCRRLEWKCDSLNAPSRRAALRLGFVFEGVFRQAVVTKGRNRDTAWFSVIDRDWPQVRDALAGWLAPGNFDAAGRQERTLAAIRQALG